MFRCAARPLPFFLLHSSAPPPSSAQDALIARAQAVPTSERGEDRTIGWSGHGWAGDHDELLDRVGQCVAGSNDKISSILHIKHLISRPSDLKTETQTQALVLCPAAGFQLPCCKRGSTFKSTSCSSSSYTPMLLRRNLMLNFLVAVRTV